MKGDPGSFEPKVRQTLPDSQTIKVKAKPSQNEPLFRDNAIRGGEKGITVVSPLSMISGCPSLARRV